MTENQHTIRRVRLGVDIGQRNDPTALVITEEQDRGGQSYYVTRALRRLPLDTQYGEVVNIVTESVLRLEQHRKALRYAGQEFAIETIVDATGVGLPIADLLKERGISPVLATFTGSEKYNQSGNRVTIGKQWMVSRLQVLISTGRLILPAGGEADVLISELKSYEPQINERTRHVSFNARSGKHDDLVIALGLSVGSDTRANVPTSQSAFAISEEEALLRSIQQRRDRRR